MNWTLQDLANIQDRLKTNKADGEADPGPESTLQKKINLWCREHGYHFLSFRKSKKAKGFLRAGHPDITIFMEEGRTVLIELKDGRGRLSEDQLKVKRILKYMKHEWYEVRSYKQFLEATRRK